MKIGKSIPFNIDPKLAKIIEPLPYKELINMHSTMGEWNQQIGLLVKYFKLKAPKKKKTPISWKMPPDKNRWN